MPVLSWATTGRADQLVQLLALVVAAGRDRVAMRGREVVLPETQGSPVNRLPLRRYL
jgi:hypothetical protein